MNDTTHRRDFLKLSALAGAGLFFPARLFAAAAAPGAGPARVGPLTSIALTDDALRLVRHAAGVAPAFRESLAPEMNVFDPVPGNAAFFAGLMPASLGDVTALLQQVRLRWEADGAGDPLRSRLALVAGWFAHRAAGDVLGPVYAGAADAETPAVYHDAAVLRARSEGTPGTATAEETAALFKEMVPRTLTRFHTLIPDHDDAAGWVTRLHGWRLEHTDRMERYASAYVQPDPDAQRRYVAQPNFYDADDPVLRVARRLRQEPAAAGAAVTDADLQAGSLYGRALVQAVRHILAASAYFEGRLDEQGLQEQLARA